MNTFSKELSKILKSCPDQRASIPLQKGGAFTASWGEDGISVDNLNAQPLLTWAMFDCIENFLRRQPDQCGIKGNGTNGKLGSREVPINSVEGRVALFLGASEGDSVFRRITPIANLLVWAKLCHHGRGCLCINTD
jgi:hypothetical protein